MNYWIVECGPIEAAYSAQDRVARSEEDDGAPKHLGAEELVKGDWIDHGTASAGRRLKASYRTGI